MAGDSGFRWGSSCHKVLNLGSQALGDIPGRPLAGRITRLEASRMTVTGTVGTWVGRGTVSVQLSPANWEPSLLIRERRVPRTLPRNTGQLEQREVVSCAPHRESPSPLPNKLSAFSGLCLPEASKQNLNHFPACPPILLDPPSGRREQGKYALCFPDEAY